MSDVTQGNHVEWPADGLLAPSEYAKRPDGMWRATTPNGHAANLSAHEVTEHEDGTVTVVPSIKVSTNTEVWHGFLERGVWREC